MEKLVKPSAIDLNITAPASKSMAQRAIIASLLANGESTLTGMTRCEDTDAAIEVAKSMGADVNFNEEEGICIIKSTFNKNSYIPSTINCGESGLLSRMMVSIMALYDDKITITGCGSLNSRPFEMIERPLRELGAEISLTDGHLPITLKWGLKGGETTIDGSVSSQFLTGLLMALPLAPRNSEVYVVDLKSRPYVDITMDILLAYGIEIENFKYETFKIKGSQKYTPARLNMEGDWSAAALLLVAGAVAGEATIGNLNINSAQGDRAILDLFKACDVDFSIVRNSVTTRKSRIKAFGFDANNCPDLFPAIAVLATQADDICCIKGVKRLRHKESNRANTIKQELEKLGIKIELDEDYMYVTPGVIKGGTVESHDDHRIAMALAVAGLCSKEGVLIRDTQSVAKSYPHFW